MAKTQPIELTVITPERQVLTDSVGEVVIPAHDGELGILHNRAPLMCELGIGQLRYARDGQVHRTFIDGGFAQVVHNRVIVLTPRALRSSEITDETVRDAEQAASAATGTDPDSTIARTRAQQQARILRHLQAVR